MADLPLLGNQSDLSALNQKTLLQKSADASLFPLYYVVEFHDIEETATSETSIFTRTTSILSHSTMFGATTQPATSGFNFGATTQPAAGGFNFGGGTPATPSSGFNFGSTSAAPAAPAAGGFNFGGTPTPAAGSSGFNFGGTSAASTATTTSGFSFGGAPTATSSGFSFGGTGSIGGNAGFGFGGTTATPAASSGFNFGGTSATPGAASTPSIFNQTTTPGTGFSFGAKPTTPGTGFGFGTGVPGTGNSTFGTPGAVGSSLFGTSGFGTTPLASTAPAPIILGADASVAQLNTIKAAYQDPAQSRFKFLMYNAVDPMQRHLYTRPPFISERLWNQAELDNPDPLNSAPVPILGFDGLLKRIKAQQEHAEKYNKYTDDLRGQLIEMDKHMRATEEKMEKCRREHIQLFHALVKIMRDIELLQNYGKPLQREENILATTLKKLQTLLDSQGQYKARLKDVVSMQHVQTESLTSPTSQLSSQDLQRLYGLMDKQRQGLEHLTNILNDDLADIELIKETWRR
ncbi:carbohydratebinding protein [Plasmopara halstedii]|uniref:Carbohydratebinding protein n=1 Tax=Plasmopara halstedii TaxID=4781 RepID=A0A0P1A9H9_PLAHL|nr:carbohydratebinding protein [Plasmopara halstedii]CEG36933.1 carbohydratebinding protein [Plasmopara halstedii]|eukprot:XP_024573302.1 carbohydratebinding protein [Plasmopara halstedii]